MKYEENILGLTCCRSAIPSRSVRRCVFEDAPRLGLHTGRWEVMNRRFRGDGCRHYPIKTTERYDRTADPSEPDVLCLCGTNK